jgi:hypothetical protein
LNSKLEKTTWKNTWRTLLCTASSNHKDIE